MACSDCQKSMTIQKYRKTVIANRFVIHILTPKNFNKSHQRKFRYKIQHLSNDGLVSIVNKIWLVR